VANTTNIHSRFFPRQERLFGRESLYFFQSPRFRVFVASVWPWGSLLFRESHEQRSPPTESPDPSRMVFFWSDEEQKRTVSFFFFFWLCLLFAHIGLEWLFGYLLFHYETTFCRFPPTSKGSPGFKLFFGESKRLLFIPSWNYFLRFWPLNWPTTPGACMNRRPPIRIMSEEELEIA